MLSLLINNWLFLINDWYIIHGRCHGWQKYLEEKKLRTLPVTTIHPEEQYFLQKSPLISWDPSIRPLVPYQENGFTLYPFLWLLSKRTPYFNLYPISRWEVSVFYLRLLSLPLSSLLLLLLLSLSLLFSLFYSYSPFYSIYETSLNLHISNKDLKSHSILKRTLDKISKEKTFYVVVSYKE